jgi:hypothetical protein
MAGDPNRQLPVVKVIQRKHVALWNDYEISVYVPRSPFAKVSVAKGKLSASIDLKIKRITGPDLSKGLPIRVARKPICSEVYPERMHLF